MATAGLVGAAALAASLLIAPFEGEKLHANLDPIAIKEICYGRTKGVTLNMHATDKQCLVWLGEDTRYAERTFDRLVTVKVSDRTKAAWIDFIYNLGSGTFARSTALKKMNAGDLKGACEQMPRYVYAGKKRMAGLIRRREAEMSLCLSGL